MHCTLYLDRVKSRITPRERLRRLRTGLGLTQEQLAKRCGLDQSKISRIESGAGRTDADALEQIVVRGLRMTMVEFYADPAAA